MLRVIVRTVISAWIVYLSSAVFQFLTAHKGVELPDNRTGCLSPSSVGEWVGPLKVGANTYQLGCFIIAACYHHCCLDFWLINYYQRSCCSPWCASYQRLKNLIPSVKSVNSQHKYTLYSSTIWWLTHRLLSTVIQKIFFCIFFSVIQNRSKMVCHCNTTSGRNVCGVSWILHGIPT